MEATPLCGVPSSSLPARADRSDPLPGNPAFGDLIRRTREAKKRGNPAFSLRQFAAAVGVSPTFISRMETGEFDPPSPDKIVKMAELLDLDRDEVLMLAEKPDPDAERFLRERPRAVAAFLRTAREVGLTDAQFDQLTRQIREQRDEQ